jgi:hypothetical protein
MRKTIATFVVLSAILIGYTAWPLYDLFVLVRAIETRDVDTVVRHVYFDQVRILSPLTCAAPECRSVRSREAWQALLWVLPIQS